MSVIDEASLKQLQSNLQHMLDANSEAIFYFDDTYYRIHAVSDDQHTVYLSETNCTGVPLPDEEIRSVAMTQFKKEAKVSYLTCQHER